MPITPRFSRRGLLVALVLAQAPAAAAAQPQWVPGTRVTLEPPAGFTPGERFMGFGRDEALASIIVTEMQAPFAGMEARMTAEAFAGQGMVLHGVDSLDVEGVPARLMSLTQDVDGAPFGKWVLMFGDDTVTTLVSATFPADSAASLGEPMRRAVLSARRGGQARNPLEGLGFHVETGRLKIATRMGNTIALTETGVLDTGEPSAPFLAIGSSVAEVDMRDVEAFARQRVMRIGSGIEITRITGGGHVTIGGQPAYQLFAEAEHRQDGGTPLQVYQVVVPEGSHYLLVQGFVGSEWANELIPEFMAIALTLRRTP